MLLRCKFLLLLPISKKIDSIFFPCIADHLKKHPDFIYDTKKIVAEINASSDEFKAWFSDFRKIEKLVEFSRKTDLEANAISQQVSEVFYKREMQLN